MPTLWTAIINHLLADETLRNLVHDRVCYGTPRFAIDTFPAVRLLLLSDIPNTHIPGDSEARLQIDVTAISAAAGLARRPPDRGTAPSSPARAPCADGV